jgi:predicted nucleotidyltransferase
MLSSTTQQSRGRSPVSLDAIRIAAAEVGRANGARLALLFGSYARGTATYRSDIDLIFVEETQDRFMDRLERYIDPLIDRLRTAVEVLVYTPEEFEQMKQAAFVGRAVREGIVLYEP